jgi:hypothetical protein
MAAAQLRAPLFEDKVVDFLFSKAEITDRSVLASSSRRRSRARKASTSTARTAITTMITIMTWRR